MWRKRVRKIDNDDRVVKDAEKARARTMNRAVKLLATKTRSAGELRTRLLEKIWTNDAIVDSVIGKLKEYKYLDDSQFAEDLAVSKLRQKPQGKRRLQQALSKKQLDRDVLENAIATAFEKLPEEDLIDKAIRKRFEVKGKPVTREETKKFYDHLIRLGFSYDLIRSKLSDIANLTSDEQL